MIKWTVKINGSDQFLHITFSELFFEEQLLLLLVSINLAIVPETSFQELSLCLCLYLSVSHCLSLYVLLCLSLSLYVCLFLSICMSVSLSLSICLSICMSLFVSPCLFLSLSLSLTLHNGRNIDLLGVDSDSNNSWQGEDSDCQTVSPSVFLGSAWGAPSRTHFDRCIKSLIIDNQTNFYAVKISWTTFMFSGRSVLWLTKRYIHSVFACYGWPC